ncbi:MAG: 4-alpha-glucanotransferase [Rhodospirillales bacterium]|nr:4-alpha-glucanotransferase [Rhodospirillales bacterium]
MSVLHEDAARAGIIRIWRDVNGKAQTVSDASLLAILEALGPEQADAEPRLLTAWAGEDVVLPGSPGPYRLELETGTVSEGFAPLARGGVAIPGIALPGYHKLIFGGVEISLAIAPRKAYGLADVGRGEKLWGLTVQLYGLKRLHDGGIGDFAALRDFAVRAAGLGADAVGISPVHALFAADLQRFEPYSPSNRAALNVLHIARTLADVDAKLINWPSAAAAKMAELRAEFETFQDWPALAAFRAQAGLGLERHALFEALSVHLAAQGKSMLDWRNWPKVYSHPENPEVADFAKAYQREVSFHAWLQWLAGQGLQTANAAMRAAGAKIGIIADLAVGTDHAGSHCWSRQDEVLHGLEIGAPPDLLNREGQSWGITAFSPRGLKRSGYSAFLDMLRHCMRHAGGVRIDHVMGLSRLWVIPLGKSSAEGAYLTMPQTDLIRLVNLESHRHKAVILGEDLGTLPEGYGELLTDAGIAGLRVMWFEHDGKSFKPPSIWTKEAVAMTTTHDVPTVAGWWEGKDIEWREKLNLAGDTPMHRAQDRKDLWAAFTASGATQAPQPPDDDGAAVSFPAAVHLGRAASMLALLPVEDALSLVEAPNLPGTSTEHPNWRRRLPGNVEQIFQREDFQARLQALSAARRLP